MPSQQEPGPEATSSPRPTPLLLAFFGSQVLDRHAGVAVGSAIEVLSHLGIGEHATRAALKRMTESGFVSGVRQGRRAYVRLSSHAESILREGARRLDIGTARQDWDGRWTLLAFSVPETQRHDRSALRTQLAWAGFGMLRSGLWIAPAPADVVGSLAALGLLGYVKIFQAQVLVPGDPAGLAAEAWDLSDLAGRYQDFADRWAHRTDAAPDALSSRVRIDAEWLLLVRDDPRLPRALLPADWPGISADGLFRSLRAELAEPARRFADASLDWL